MGCHLLSAALQLKNDLQGALLAAVYSGVDHEGGQLAQHPSGWSPRPRVVVDRQREGLLSLKKLTS